MRPWHPILLLALGAGIAVAGYWLIFISCPYSILSTAMTGAIKVPGTWMLLPYRWVLSIAVYLALRAVYLAARGGSKPRKGDPLLLAVLGVGIAVIGFLAVDYPCPYAIGTWILQLEASIAGLRVPYLWILALAVWVMLYAAYVWFKPRAPGGHE
jgi:hypothetical protein